MLHALLRELEWQKDYLDGRQIQTIYFGGGTPSLLSADELNRIFEQVYRHFNVAEHIECTLEANPDDLSAFYSRSLRQTPVNRFSIGIQSFHDEDLRYMSRAHNAQQADAAVKTVQDAGFENITIDLIYGTPSLTNEGWEHNLDKVRQLRLPHFSAYALTVEEGTLLHQSIKKGKTIPVDVNRAADQFEILLETADIMGFEHYEISNLSKPGYRAVHNTNYWLGIPYLGIGPSAHSFDGNDRQYNISNNALYIDSIVNKSKLIFEKEVLNPVQRLNEYIMTSLRAIWGCDLEKIDREWGSYYASTIEKDSQLFIEKKWLSVHDKKLILTRAGKLFADKIAAELFVAA